ncbi:MAG: translation initiation factor IF-2 [Clostridia bacterium]|nr:translation initiation factor IF-2 [Clostridia bacterium]
MTNGGTKIKLSDFAKKFGMSVKDMTELLAKYNIEKKNSTASITGDEINVFFAHHLKQYDNGDTILEAYTKINAELSAEREKAVAEREAKKAKKEAEEKAKKAAEEAAAKKAEEDRKAAEKAEADKKAAEKAEKIAKKKEQERLEKQKKAELDKKRAEELEQLKKSVSENNDIESIEIKKEDTRKVIDTRQNVVDLDKLDTEKIEKLVDMDMSDKAEKKQKIKKGPKKQEKAVVQKTPVKKKEEEKKEPAVVEVPDEISVGEFAELMKLPASTVVKKLFELGIMASVSQTIDFDTASLVGEDLGFIVEKLIIVTEEDKLFNDVEDAPESLKPRSPVVVVMGHVDHGKTSLLDAIRNTNVIAKEAGGITQHIGAYRVRIHDKKITFLDTPGHEAFTAMRLRGAQVTDIAIIVVAADDGIMPQTVEAINHAKAAGVTIIVAINKIDKEGANPDRIKQELTEYDLVPEEWGGDTICVPISAKFNKNIDELLEMVTLVADMKELKANPDRMGKGTVVEAQLDKGRGPVATVLVQNGTLRVGDVVVAGTAVGRVRAMVDDRGNQVKKAGPSVPVEIIGLSEVPDGGDAFYAVTDERKAREVVEQRKFKAKEEANQARKAVSLDSLFDHIKEGEMKTFNIIVKADVQGSVEAVKQSLEKLSNEEVRVACIHGGVGGITESDVMLAAASNAVIVGFNVRPNAQAVSTAARDNVDIRTYRVIYTAIEEIEAAMKGMLAPEFKEVVYGHAEVRNTFKVSGVGTIAGGYVQEGKILRNSQVRIVRDGIVIHEGVLASLKRFKDDAKEVASGYECGIGIENFNDIKEGDIIESFDMEEVER